MSNSLKLLLASFVLFSLSVFCPSAEAQFFTIKTNAEDCEVFVENVKVGTGKSVKVTFDKNFYLKQIKVTRPGYLPVHEVASIKEKEIYIEVNRKTYKSESGIIPIALKSISLSDAGGYTYYYDYDKFRKREYVQEYHYCTDKTAIRELLQDVNLFFVKALAGTGVVDTNYSMMKSDNYKCFLETKLKRARCLFYETSRNCSQMAVQLEVEVQYEFKDRFGKVIYDLEKSGKSGIYSLDQLNWLKIDPSERRAFLNGKMEEAIINSVVDLLADTASAVIFKDDEPLAASKMASLQLKNNSPVTDIKSALKSTVTINTGESFGSGCVVSNDGYILTSYHVIADVPDSLLEVLVKTDTLKAKVVRTSKSADLALIKVDRTFPHAFSLISNTEIEITDEVMAIGTPASMELSQTVSKGIVSAIRKVGEKSTIIQTDVPVNPGNSGGPLIKMPGVFIGVVNSKISGGRMEGLGFCTPVYDVITHLKLNGK
jgi:hypothetical protein